MVQLTIYSNNGLDNGLVANRPQAIIWNNDGLGLWWYSASMSWTTGWFFFQNVILFYKIVHNNWTISVYNWPNTMII